MGPCGRSACSQGSAAPAAAELSGQAARGALDQITTPEQLAKLRRLVASAASAASTAAVRAAMSELGAQHLGAAVQQTAESVAERTSALAVRGAVHELFPACDGGDPGACIEQRVEAISRAASRGATRGARDSLGLLALGAAFVLGVACASLVAWGSAVRVERRIARARTGYASPSTSAT